MIYKPILSRQQIRGAIIINVTNRGKSPKGGTTKCGLFEMRGGVWIIGGFPNVNVDFNVSDEEKCKFVLKWSFGNFEYKTHWQLYWNETAILQTCFI